MISLKKGLAKNCKKTNNCYLCLELKYDYYITTINQQKLKTMGKTFQDDCRTSLFCKLALIAFLLFPAMNVLQAGTLSAKTVSGTVKSAADGEVLIGASVQVLGTTGGAVTDLDGHYSVEVEDG